MPRLFFALWPDAAAAEALDRLAAQLQSRAGGRATPRAKIHLTLAFLGDVPPDRADDLVRAADTVKEKPFEVVLDRIGSFRHARVAWVGAESPAPALVSAEATLREALRSRGFGLEERPFTPHVTLVRKTERSLARAAIEPIAWTAAEIALVRSDTGKGTYTTMATWALGGKRRRPAR
jgi:RNA 2',3'-cyclic 3'-phosphodiesterase